MGNEWNEICILLDLFKSFSKKLNSTHFLTMEENVKGFVT